MCFSSIHSIRHETLTNLVAGLRVYVIGKLRSTNFQSTGENASTSSLVNADKVFVLENPNRMLSELTESDVNSVQLIANVVSKDANEENDSSLSVAIKHKSL